MAVRPQPNLTTKPLRLKEAYSAEEDRPLNGLLLPPQGVVPEARLTEGAWTKTATKALPSDRF